jgi:calcineurin-like phosphoesterase family protein
MQNDVREKKYQFQSSKNIYFISDPHFGHANIIKYCDRPFKSVEEMNAKLIENWNNRVKPNDIIFILGDIAFGGAGVFEEIVPKLNGQKYLVLGNHDYKNVRERYREWFVDVAPKMFISIDGQPIILNHEPLLCFGGQMNNRTWHFFGHVHTSKTESQGSDYKLVRTMCTPSMYDVGADFNDFTPIKWQEVRDIVLRQIEKNKNFLQLWESEHMKYTYEEDELGIENDYQLMDALKKYKCSNMEELDTLLYYSYGVRLIDRRKRISE